MQAMHAAHAITVTCLPRLHAPDMPAQAFESWQSWDSNPLYALLHESIYCQGAASAWSAQRVLDQHFSREFDAAAAAAEGRPVAFTGEMVYKWMFEVRTHACMRGRACVVCHA